MRRRRAPQYAPSYDQHGQCLHLYLTRDATCVHCGMQFGLAWEAERRWLTQPLFRNLAIAAVAAVLYGVALVTGGSTIASPFLVVTALFATRGGLGGLETLAKHRFISGILGPLVPHRRFNFLAPKPSFAYVGAAKVPLEAHIYELFRPGDPLLVEHLLWSRLPVAIYRGQMDK